MLFMINKYKNKINETQGLTSDTCVQLNDPSAFNLLALLQFTKV